MTSRPKAPSKMRAFSYQVRYGTTLAVLCSFWAVTPMCWIFVSHHVATSYVPSLHAYAPTPSTKHSLLFLYTLAEVIFSIAYQTLALSISPRRPASTYSPRQLHDVMRGVLEANMNSATAPASSSSPPSDDESNQLSPTQSTHRRFSVDSGYGSKSPSRAPSRKSSLSSLAAQAPLPPSLSPPLSTTSTLGEPYTFLGDQGLTPTDPRALDFQANARHWFGGAPFGDLTRDDACSWMSWGLYGVPYEELVAERLSALGGEDAWTRGVKTENIGRDRRETVDISTDLWGARAGVRLPSSEGRDARGAKPVAVMRLTLDPIRVLQRPLALYVLIAGAQAVYAGKLGGWGFRKLEFGGMSYWIRIPEGWREEDGVEDESRRPLLFIHGLGVGAVQYSPILNKFASSPEFTDRPVAILCQPHLSMSIFSKGYLSPPNADKSATSFAKMAKGCGFERSGVTILSHSNGTIVHSCILKAIPDLVRRSGFVDPVCFALWEPFLPYNFLFAPPTTPFASVTRFLVARELGVSNTLQRHFDWISANLFPSQIPHATESASRASVFLSERDTIVDAPRVGKYLREEGVMRVEVFKGAKHGEGMAGRGKGFKRVLEWVRDV